jgi:hypothetical protein
VLSAGGAGGGDVVRACSDRVCGLVGMVLHRAGVSSVVTRDRARVVVGHTARLGRYARRFRGKRNRMISSARPQARRDPDVVGSCRFGALTRGRCAVVSRGEPANASHAARELWSINLIYELKLRCSPAKVAQRRSSRCFSSEISVGSFTARHEVRSYSDRVPWM